VTVSTASHQSVVLVVDDDDDFRESLGEALIAEGCCVVDARSGEEALALLEDAALGRRATPDLLILDLLMPRVSGIEVLQKVRKRRMWSSLPILVVTSVNDQMLPVRLDLPVAFKTDISAVLDAVRQLLARR
jgi:CheY-like chemotaxis protein